MKQNLAILALTLCGFAYFSDRIPAPDPTGIKTIQALQKAGALDTLPETGLVADPSGVVLLKAIADKKP